MTTSLQLSAVVGQLTPEHRAMLESYAEFLLLRQQPHPTNDDWEKVRERTAAERLEIVQRFKGDATFPDFPTSKYDVYEQ